MKGIILAGGIGSRLYPLTAVVNKHLLPVYDKPLLYYPLSVLMLAGVRDILVVCDEASYDQYQRLFHCLTAGLTWKVTCQPVPHGIIDALQQARAEIDDGRVIVALGDNFLYGSGLHGLLRRAVASEAPAQVFLYRAKDIHQFGVAVLRDDKVTALYEKPGLYVSPWAVIGLYILDGLPRMLDASQVTIIDLLHEYLRGPGLIAYKLGRGYYWLDAGTPASLLCASQFVATIQESQGLLVGCPEEVALHNEWITADQLSTTRTPETYRAYLGRLKEGL
jgi:glucose-1-phosphate thymidylyltransferase